MHTSPAQRRHHQIDALRVIALVLLILYHIFLSYQPFGPFFKFLPYEQSLEKFWFLGQLVNIWRIPVLFVISGMAFALAMQRRSLFEVYIGRMTHLVPPLVFGSLVIFPVFPILYSLYLHEPLEYIPTPGHLWFLKALISYTLCLLPFAAWIKRRPDNGLIRILRASLPFSLIAIVPIPLMLETTLSKPTLFTFFSFSYGLICYFIGFILICVVDKFWHSARMLCHLALPLAALFYLGRIEVIDWPAFRANHCSTSFESWLWIVAFLGYGSICLDRPSKTFTYLNQAVFPIYIIHMPIQQLVACVIFRLQLAPELTFMLHTLLTLLACWLLYEFGIRRIRFLYPLMGLKPTTKDRSQSTLRIGVTTIVSAFILAPLIFIEQIHNTAATITAKLSAADNRK